MNQQGINVLVFVDGSEFWIRVIENTLYGSSGFVYVFNAANRKEYNVLPNAPKPPPGGLNILSGTEAIVSADLDTGMLVVHVKVEADGPYIGYNVHYGSTILDSMPMSKCDPDGRVRIIGKPDMPTLK